MLANSRLLALSSLALLATIAPSLAGCSDDGTNGGPAQGREEGQTEFESAPPVRQGGASFDGSRGESAGDTAAPSNAGAQTPVNAPKPQETDIYRVDGNRLYFLNSYRGLMVFDITNADDPKLLGRSPVYGTPVEMFVENGIATMVVGDWYGNAPDGSPFHGSVVRTVDARDPANMKVHGEVQVKGWARDMRVVGQNLFIVSEDYGWHYGVWYGGYYGGGLAGDVAYPGGYYGGTSKVVISSVKFGNFAPTMNSTKEFDGYSGAFNVTSNEILMAHDVLADGPQGSKQPTGKSAIDYFAFSQLDGALIPMGTFEVDGLLNGWSADNGRWNIDLDGTTASVITCAGADYGYCRGQGGYKVTTIDFSNPASPQKLGTLDIPSKGWAATARFANKRMYLSPREGAWSPNGQQQPTPVEIYDLSTPAAPALAGSTSINGAVWLFMPMGTDRLFALGNEYGNGYSSSKVALRLLDVSDATRPTVIGTSTFGDGWAWTPASGTFKAFTRDDSKKLVVLPFSGWSSANYEYMNGLQLIEYDTGAITTKGAAKSKGWVERGVFVKNRLVSLSDQALSVIDYADRNNPKVVKELTLARNVVAAEPNGATIAQLSTDWWGYDNKTSELRVLPIANAEENVTDPNARSVSIDGTNARVFRNGDLAYVVTTLYPTTPNGPSYATPHVQVVDLSNGGATLKGSLDLPQETNGSYWSWWG
ncbi:MAG: beta-propeller domain-containing protein, partial [Myxococcales bacterium]|nr:beta-propeller domain-containing protein [Myxococcales bacterium]